MTPFNIHWIFYHNLWRFIIWNKFTSRDEMMALVIISIVIYNVVRRNSEFSGYIFTMLDCPVKMCGHRFHFIVEVVGPDTALFVSWSTWNNRQGLSSTLEAKIRIISIGCNSVLSFSHKFSYHDYACSKMSVLTKSLHMYIFCVPILSLTLWHWHSQLLYTIFPYDSGILSHCFSIYAIRQLLCPFHSSFHTIQLLE